MTISVVIATYNRASLLQDCLDQLRRQPYQPGDEVIVVDNASTDGTAGIIAGMVDRFPVPLRQIRETTPGKTPALNSGIAVSTGDILALTDDDVVVADDWIPTVRKLFSEQALALVGGRVNPRWETPAPRWLEVERDGRFSRMSSPLALLHYGERQDLGMRSAVGANLVVRRGVLDAVGGFDPHLGRVRGTLMCGEDHEFCQRVVSAGHRAIYAPDLVVRHWVPAERMSVRYYIRWFFWSGVTNAMLEADAGLKGPSFLGVPRYLWYRLVMGAVKAPARLLTGQPAAAASATMEVAFAAGYIWQRAAIMWERQEISAGRQQAPQLPASAQSPAIPVPGVEAGKLCD
jgi:glucosyl-dolichyl phosphate glucuronosyltransferase